MMSIDVPGGQKLDLEHLVLDYNGTIACDGRVIAGVKDRLIALSKRLSVHVLTADTFGSVRHALEDFPCKTVVIPKDHQAEAKADYIDELGAGRCVAAGNGRNDALMLKEAVLGIAVIQAEGCAVEALLAADIVSANILDAMDLLLCPLRLAATLRS